METSKFKTKGLTKIEKFKCNDHQMKKNLLFCYGKTIRYPLADFWYESVVYCEPIVWAILVANIVTFIKFEPFQGREANTTVLVYLLVIFLFYWINFLKKRGPRLSNITFNRDSGTVVFDRSNNTKAFEVPFEHLELYIGKFSIGWGVRYYHAFVAPQIFPEGVGKHRMFEVAIKVETVEEATEIWAAHCQFMDKSRPIPKCFYRYMQLLLEEEGDEVLPPEIVSQAPFCHPSTFALLDKDIW